ncbi:putative homeodomain transcription factor [Ctenocephalides felis]|uniref:putative homeodomain transcription factor n=1 Tax=Ctenocephalides felis TaxID=7515 RepID=UPI000E6E3F19|nr:putative homeodomain transcription factor [Ctenocephalides felis]
MGLQDVVSWYQKKIGTYDKQQWERTVEQRILDGITHVPMKSARIKTELIDVDLVRGSSFPKAKPKHGLVTVARLAILRLILLPIYSKWWVQQTSARIFGLLLALYGLQCVNLAVYTYHNEKNIEDEHEKVTISEIIVPIAMMLLLSIIHTQIVSTNPGPIKSPPKRLRRNTRKRRKPSFARSRNQSESKLSDHQGSTTNLKNIESDKYFQRTRVRITQSDTKDSSIRRRVVAWESPVHVTTTLSIETNKQSSKNNEMIDADALELRSSEEFISAEVTDSLIKNDRETLKLVSSVLKPGTSSGAAGGNQEFDNPEPTTPLDDDGFESLNGNGSSENGEDVSQRGNSEEPNFESDQSTPGKKSSENEHAPGTKYFDAEIENAIGCLNVKTKFTTTTSSDNKDCDNNGPISINYSVGNDEVQKVRENNSRYDTDIRKAWVHEVLENRSPASVMLEKPILNNSDTDTDTLETLMNSNSSLLRRRGSHQRRTAGEDSTFRPLSGNSNCSTNAESIRINHRESSGDTEEEGDCDTVSTPGTVGSCCPHLNDTPPSVNEWIGVTTNSEECSYSSELEETDSQYEHSNADLVDHPFAWEFGSNTVLSPSCAASDRVSCTVWDHREIKKADLSVLDISSTIIARVEGMPETCDYFYGGVALSILLALIPAVCRLCRFTIDHNHADDHLSVLDLLSLVSEKMSGSFVTLIDMAFGQNLTTRMILIISLTQRIILSCLFFFLLAVAERVFKQRFLYAKLFSHLTSSRRARKSELPHFRLNKVRNIKTWLSVRSYLKKRGPQRSVDVIVSAACLITLLLLSFLSVELLRDSVHLHSQCNVEAFAWSLALGMFLLRFITLGTKINQKYRNLSVLITEQINLYLQIEQKPNKKEELMVANSVLKLAADLLKELESPFKISGLSANPILYTITKVVILSALSGILSEMLGFKLKLHKIKIK